MSAPHNPNTAAARSANKARLARMRQARLDNLADLLADGHSLSDAGEVLGITPSYARRTMAVIREQLGWQAQ